MKNEIRLVKRLLLVGSCLTALLFASPAMSNCDSGHSPETGLRDSIVPGTGTGGTGLEGSGEPGSGTGTGGTGFSGTGGTGTGGTGIFGLVTGFGSVCVNGLEVEYDADSRIHRDGEPATVSDLSIGQTVRITTSKARPLFASRIDVENALSGPIDRIDPSAHRLWVMGQSVQLRPDGIVFDRESGQITKLDQLQTGAHISVSGLRRTDGVISASRLDQGPPSEHASVTAILRELTEETAYLGDVRAILPQPSATLPETNRSGRRVRVIGRWNSRTRTLEASRVEAAPVVDPHARRVSIQGFAAPSSSDADFRLAGTGIEVRQRTENALKLNIDAFVRIEGRIDELGRVHADRIFVDTPGRHGHPIHSDDEDSKHGTKADDDDHGDRSGREDREDRSGRDRNNHGDRSERPERGGRSGRGGRARN